MTPENKATWLEALRSGRYEQITSALHADGAYCCLGVAVEVLTDLGWDDCDDCTEHKDSKQIGGTPKGVAYVMSLPHFVAERLGFNDIVPRNVIDKVCPDLFLSPDAEWTWERLAIHLNDSRRLTFNQIARVMEKYL